MCETPLPWPPSVSPEGRFRGQSSLLPSSFPFGSCPPISTTEYTETGFAGHGKEVLKNVVPAFQPQFCHDSMKSVAQERDPPGTAHGPSGRDALLCVLTAPSALYSRYPRRVVPEWDWIMNKGTRFRPQHNLVLTRTSLLIERPLDTEGRDYGADEIFLIGKIGSGWDGEGGGMEKG